MSEPVTHLSIKPLDLAVLLYHLHRSVEQPEIGYNDADVTLDEITTNLSWKPLNIRTYRVEAALYCCNLMNELGHFWHPQNKSFDDFLKDIALQNVRREPLAYNKFFNYFEGEKSKQMSLTPSDKPDTID